MNDEFFMRRAIELARLGSGTVAPNPMVGAVIVHNNRIIGEGFHERFGEAHAEVNAVNSVEDKSLLSASTIYVTLEPCTHFGKTPPCCDLLIHHDFKHVVVGTHDPFDAVNGKGIEKIETAGIPTTIGVLAEECRAVNHRFFCFHEKKRPYVILKWAQTQNGYMDRIRKLNETGVHWISSPDTKPLVHKWRSEEQAILVGTRTVLNDNPSLTVREYSGTNPIRLVLDKTLQIPASSAVFNDEASTIVYNTLKNETHGNVEFKQLLTISIEAVLADLSERNIISVFVEGGAATLQSFIDAGLWDEARILIGSTMFDTGLSAPIIAQVPSQDFHFGDDRILIYKNQ